MRILWDLYDSDGLDDHGLDLVALGYQGLFNLITNTNLPAAGAAAPAKTLSDLWRNIEARTTVSARVEYGGVFELNNAAPGEGTMENPDGVEITSWSTAAPGVPTFYARMPWSAVTFAGATTYPIAELFSGMKIYFYNDDYSVRLFQTTTPTQGADNWYHYTPGATAWAAITAGAGPRIRHVVFVGVRFGNQFYDQSIEYWSSSFDIQID